MQSTQAYLEILRDRGGRRLPLKRVYRHLQDRELFLRAYAKLYANEGALTPGVDPNDTADGMSLQRINKIIEALRTGTYRWRPVRRAYIQKKRNGKPRPLGVPSWEDKLLQEAIRIVLSAYYEPQFSDATHGFRPGRGCHTALQSILLKWKGTKWFIEGDIRGCFDNIPHDKLLEIIRRNIQDERLIKLIRGMLKAGYIEDWRYHQTYSGTPQGGIVSPLLANIFLNELDMYIENELTPQYTRGQRRQPNPEYVRVSHRKLAARDRGDRERYRQLHAIQGSLPSKDPYDPEFRRLRYVRYADDFLLGFIGPRSEAETIKRLIGERLEEMGLHLSEQKTLITHATHSRARFLGYDVGMAKADSRKCRGKRSINGQPILGVPDDVVAEWRKRHRRRGKIIHRTELLNCTDYDIVATYATEFQGLANYYEMAYNVSRLHKVKNVYKLSLLKTLAAKHKTNVKRVYRRTSRKLENGVTAILVEMPREGKRPLVAMFGAKPIRYNQNARLSDTRAQLWPGRNELVYRLLAEKCELCGSTEGINVHHVRSLKDLKRRYQGRKQPPRWVIRMSERRRKTLVVCTRCHNEIHRGKHDGPSLS